MMKPKILLVDDEQDVVDGYRRTLRRNYEVLTALSGREGLELIDSSEPPCVVVSDYRMPEMNGVEFLAQVRERRRDTVRIMLTGQADFEAVTQAVNEGNVFRFMTKPCSADALMHALDAGIEQYRLVRVEKELLNKTLTGAVKAINDILALVHPGVFGRIARIRRIVGDLAREFHEEKAWQWEIAAMLSQVGCVTLSGEMLAKMRKGEELKADEQKMFLHHPKIGAELISNIPRLEEVSRIVEYQEKNFDGSGPPANDIRGEDIPLGARVLHVVLAYDRMLLAGGMEAQALFQIKKKSDMYDSSLVAALEKVLNVEALPTQRILISDLEIGMVLAEDVLSPEGLLLLAKGQEVTATLKRRMENLKESQQKEQYVEVEWR
ncbi:response regulator [Candidatus Sumerlaeota bacterium]|nr:response regulator [Candidatus Sumerlaeota bacterium]